MSCTWYLYVAKICHSSQQPCTTKSTNTKDKPPADKLRIDNSTEEFEHFPDDAILKFQEHSTRPIVVTLELNGKSVVMEVDNRVAVTLMSETTHKKLFPDAQLQKTTVKFHTYSAELESLEVQVRYANCIGK